MKRLASWNVNGIRACVNKGFVDWVKQDKADVICLQEIKALEEQFPKELDVLKEDYQFYVHSAEKKGYSGVAVLTKETPLKVIDKIGIEKFDCEGRVLILEFSDFVLFNCYFPNGQRDHGRVDYKLEFYAEILKLYENYRTEKRDVVITGDFNTAHEEIDLANPKSNKKTTGFLERERKWIDHYLEAGLVDCLRYFHPGKTGIYSWWTYRSNCRERNIGWRIDYFMANEEFLKKWSDCFHLPNVLGSDHCPIVLEKTR